MDNKLPSRKSMRLPGYDYSKAGYYFVTICAKDQAKLFGNIVGTTVPGRPHERQPVEPCVQLTELGSYIDSAIMYYNMNSIILIDKYIIIPNHIHMIVIIRPATGDRGRSPLHDIVRNFKSYITKKVSYSPWQRGYHDHIIRNEAQYQKIWQYIDENPIKWTEDYYYAE